MVWRLLRWLFSPHIFEVLALFLAAIGVSMALAPSADDIKRAHFFFGGAFLLALGRVIHWLISEQTLTPKPLIAALVFAGIGGGWMAVYQWVQSKLPTQAAASSNPAISKQDTLADRQDKPKKPGSTEKPPTLVDLFKSDLPNTLKITDEERVAIQWTNGDILRIKTQIYADFPAKTQFVGLYIPSSTKTYQACLRLVDAVRETIQDAPKHTGVRAGYRGESNMLEELTFSGRVLLYHEPGVPSWIYS